MIEDYHKIEKSFQNVDRERKELIKIFDLKKLFIKTVSCSKMD